MLASANKSRPVYGRLEPDENAALNVVVGQADGLAPIARLLKDGGPHFGSRTILIISGCESVLSEPLGNLRARHSLPTLDTALVRLEGILATAMMGTRLYVCGSEELLGKIVQLAERCFIDHKSIFTEHYGSITRRVQCVHCKGITENVTRNIVQCAHCGEVLAVRDHYSRRLSAFMAVSADAEAPGQLPTAEELYR